SPGRRDATKRPPARLTDPRPLISNSAMDLSYTPEEEAFRAKVAAWIKDNAPRRDQRSDLQAMRDWQRRLHKAGFLGAGWPTEHGGADLTPMQQAIFNEEMARVGAPGAINSMAIWWVGPAIMKYGTEE